MNIEFQHGYFHYILFLFQRKRLKLHDRLNNASHSLSCLGKLKEINCSSKFSTSSCNQVDTGPEQHLLDLSSNWWRLKQKDVDTDLLLVSGEYRVRVHQAVLLPLSTFLQELVPVSCPCSTPAIILPPMQGHTLSALVEIVYTGRY